MWMMVRWWWESIIRVIRRENVILSKHNGGMIRRMRMVNIMPVQINRWWRLVEIATRLLLSERMLLLNRMLLLFFSVTATITSILGRCCWRWELATTTTTITAAINGMWSWGMRIRGTATCRHVWDGAWLRKR